jgi:hypothetical protein
MSGDRAAHQGTLNLRKLSLRDRGSRRGRDLGGSSSSSDKSLRTSSFHAVAQYQFSRRLLSRDRLYRAVSEQLWSSHGAGTYRGSRRDSWQPRKPAPQTRR